MGQSDLLSVAADLTAAHSRLGLAEMTSNACRPSWTSLALRNTEPQGATCFRLPADSLDYWAATVVTVAEVCCTVVPGLTWLMQTWTDPHGQHPSRCRMALTSQDQERLLLKWIQLHSICLPQVQSSQPERRG